MIVANVFLSIMTSVDLCCVITLLQIKKILFSKTFLHFTVEMRRDCSVLFFLP